MDPRAQTFEALEAFIQAQKTLLLRTHSDLERLQTLRGQLIQKPLALLDLKKELDNGVFSVDDLTDYQLNLPTEIDWSVCETQDPLALESFASNTRQSYALRNQPQSHQLSELSYLQRYVKQARLTIIDPVLAKFADLSEPETESEEEIDPEELERERARQKIRDLKKNKIRASGLMLPARHAQTLVGVFIRQDVEDESLDVDISADSEKDKSTSITSTPMEIDTPTTSVSLTSTVSSPKPSTSSKPLRSRRPTVKAQISDAPLEDSRPTKKAKKEKTIVKADESSGVPLDTNKDLKPKPETYKQAWSVSEQHLLEQLLEEIPDGEKFRWLRISRAMNGRRTPRQVASRVQKYFEKLKRFGIGVGSDG